VGRDQGTDVDILGVRFPWRGEVIEEPMPDSPVFTAVLDRPHFVIAEVKTGLCDLNGPWSKPERGTLQQVLAAVGFCPPADLDSVAQALYESGRVSGRAYCASLLCLGKRRNPNIHARYPAVPQVTWEEVLRFIQSRFWKYRSKKVSHEQWDSAGHQLWNAVEASQGNADAFIRGVEVVPPGGCRGLRGALGRAGPPPAERRSFHRGAYLMTTLQSLVRGYLTSAGFRILEEKGDCLVADRLVFRA
jgi:hypothetical protein